jgi:hypothetical protein
MGNCVARRVNHLGGPVALAKLSQHGSRYINPNVIDIGRRTSQEIIAKTCTTTDIQNAIADGLCDESVQILLQDRVFEQPPLVFVEPVVV